MIRIGVTFDRRQVLAFIREQGGSGLPSEGNSLTLGRYVIQDVGSGNVFKVLRK